MPIKLNIHLCEVGIDVGGVGITYKHILSQLGVRTYDIKSRSMNVVIPIRNEQMLGIDSDFYKQEIILNRVVKL